MLQNYKKLSNQDWERLFFHHSFNKQWFGKKTASIKVYLTC